ncbi:polyprotein [Plakobranchus ocellatus]|uniref:Polyprotein n=1 Tax=Plakobranchus ocellatus TaxID=259542 RepID=A0AAV4B2S7_9GAST|nr:polyprotein [Plakobranchus ocellatus]
MEVVGKCTLYVMDTPLLFYVIDTREDPILGLCASQTLNLIKVMEIHPEQKDGVYKQFPDVFEGIGALPGLYHIETDPDVTPIHHAARRLPISLNDRVKKELNKMEKLGVIKKQESFTDWASPMVVVEKPNKSLRICLDPRNLNKAIKRERFTIPNPEEILAKLAGAKYFSKFDATSGFWQIQLDAESSKLCTMNTPFDLYSFQRCPFGISSAPEIFNKYMRKIFENQEGIESFFDDVIVWGRTWQELKEREIKCMELARMNNLKFNEEKTVLGAMELKYLGHIINSEGSRPDPEKIQAINDMKIQDNKGLQRYLGMVTYVGKFVPNLSEITKPLRDLLHKDAVWQWTRAQDEAVNKINEAITNSPILKHFDLNKEVTVSSDSSQYGLGAALLQDGHVVSYASRSLNPAERNYAQIEKEALSVVFACE